MKTPLILKYFALFSILSMAFYVSSCKKSQCEECTKTIGGFAGNSVMEQRTVCNDNEISDLEASSSGTTVWECE